MSDYQKTQWNEGGAPGISAENLNKIEAGIDTAHDELHAHEAATNVHGATSDATASRLIVRDAQGRAKVAAPSASDDIARKAEADAVQANLNSHAALTTAHGSTSAATAGAIMQRDAYGRAKVAAPSASDDIARKDTVDAVQTNLNTHKTAATIDHPDGSVTLAKIASAAKTSAGGTEANRLAVTDANGKVGAALNSDKLSSRTVAEIQAFLTVTNIPTLPIAFCLDDTNVYTLVAAGTFRKVVRASGAETTLAAPPAGVSWMDIFICGADSIMAVGSSSSSPYHTMAARYSISGNSWSGTIDVMSGYDNYAAVSACGCWDGGSYAYIACAQRPSSGQSYRSLVRRITLADSTVQGVWDEGDSSSAGGALSIGMYSTPGIIYWVRGGSSAGYLRLSSVGVDGSGLVATIWEIPNTYGTPYVASNVAHDRMLFCKGGSGPMTFLKSSGFVRTVAQAAMDSFPSGIVRPIRYWGNDVYAVEQFANRYSYLCKLPNPLA